MSLRRTFVRYVFSVLVVFGLVSTAAAADRKTTNILLGAGVGAAAGSVLSEGDPLVTLGSAAAGGVLGSILTEDRKHRSYSTPRHYKNGHRHAKKHHRAKKHYGNKHRYAPNHRYVSKGYGHGHKKPRHHRGHGRHR